MRSVRVKPHIRMIFVVGLILFALNRFLIRPWVLQAGAPEAAVIFVQTLPNFIEAVFGTLLAAIVGLSLRDRYGASFLHDAHIYALATVVAGIYVLLQEFDLHHLGGMTPTTHTTSWRRFLVSS